MLIIYLVYNVVFIPECYVNAIIDGNYSLLRYIFIIYRINDRYSYDHMQLGDNQRSNRDRQKDKKEQIETKRDKNKQRQIRDRKRQKKIKGDRKEQKETEKYR